MFIMGKERDYIIHNENVIKGFFGEYRFLSNFHLADVWYEGLLYISTENAYQAAKTLNVDIRKEFINIKPNVSKSKGREVELRTDWETIKYEVMFAVVFDKFTRHADLKEKLLLTGDKYLEETNHWGDTYYGVCNGKGLNVLGNILMLVRDIIRKNPNINGIPLSLFN